MPGSFTAISIFAFDLDDRGQPIQVWETVVESNEADAIEEAKELAYEHAGTLVVSEKAVPPLGKKAIRSSSSRPGGSATSTSR